MIHCIEDWIKDKGQVVIEDCYSNFFRNICNNGLLEVSLSEIFAKVWDNSEELLQFILFPLQRFSQRIVHFIFSISKQALQIFDVERLGHILLY